MPNNLITNTEYLTLLKELKTKVANAQIKASLAVNKQLIMLYWEIGGAIVKAQQSYNWGEQFIKKIAQDLSKSFPEMKGLSSRNLAYMRQFAVFYPEIEFMQQAVAQIPWGHNVLLMNKKLPAEESLWYIQQTIENGWSRNVLEIQIENSLYQRQVKEVKLSNFTNTLPPAQSDLAHNLMKDTYILDFLSQGKYIQEREMERELMEHIQKFLLELGQGFAFVGSQYHLEVGGEDFYIDLLFYHLKLRSYVVIELKTGKFKPEYAGKMNFYLNVVDDKLKHSSDNSSIGLILCKDRNRIVAEYALKDSGKPIGLAGYKLPERLKANLPSVEELEKELSEETMQTAPKKKGAKT